MTKRNRFGRIIESGYRRTGFYYERTPYNYRYLIILRGWKYDRQWRWEYMHSAPTMFWCQEIYLAKYSTSWRQRYFGRWFFDYIKVDKKSNDAIHKELDEAKLD